MRQMHFVVLVVFSLVFTSCATQRGIQSIEPKISMDQAKQICFKFLDDHELQGKYLPESANITEFADQLEYWFVSVKHVNWQSIAPPTILIWVHKITGEAKFDTHS